MTLTQGQNNTVTVNVTRGGGFTGAVDLSLAGVPTGVTGTFDPATVPSGSTTSTLTLSATRTAATGAHELVVRARGDGVEGKTATLQLAVEAAPLPSTRWQHVSVGVLHSCGLTAAGQAYCWGAEERGLLGNDSTGKDQPKPVPVAGGHSWVQLSADAARTCAVTPAREAYCWGMGGLGTGQHQMESAVPVQVAGGHRWLSVSVGVGHTCGLTTAGEAYCWGDNGLGQLGIDPGGNWHIPAHAPVPVSGGHTWTAVSAGEFHTCGVTTAGAAYCWGKGAEAQLGDGNTSEGANGTPLRVLGDHAWSSISAGRFHTCGVTTGGQAYCWGQGDALGNGDSRNHATPVLVAGGHTWARVHAGQQISCGVTTAGEGHCWGVNIWGRLGTGDALSPGSPGSLVPARVAGGHTWSNISAGYSHTCGVTTREEAYCWGYNDRSVLGIGVRSGETYPSPMRVADP